LLTSKVFYSLQKGYVKVPPFRLESNGFNSDLNDLFAFRFGQNNTFPFRFVSCFLSMKGLLPKGAIGSVNGKFS